MRATAVTQPHPVISRQPGTSRQWQLLAPCGQLSPGNVCFVLNLVRVQPHPDPAGPGSQDDVACALWLLSQLKIASNAVGEMNGTSRRTCFPHVRPIPCAEKEPVLFSSESIWFLNPEFKKYKFRRSTAFGVGMEVKAVNCK